MTSSDRSRDDDSFAALFEKGEAPKRQRHISVGDEVDGVVVKVGRDAVFLDLDGKREAFVDREALLDGDGNPIVLEIGDTMHARIAEIGGRAGGVRLEPLSIRKPGQADEEASEEQVELVGATGPKLATGAHVKGEVVRIESYGVFVQIEGTTGRQGRGLLPASETGLPKGTDLRKKLPVGSQIEVKILNIAEDGKIRLSIRALQVDEERASFEKFASNGPAKGGGSRAGFGTLADAFAKSAQRAKKK